MANKNFISGGKGGMHGRIGAGVQTPGKSSQEGGGRLGGGVSASTPKAGPTGAGFYASGATNKDYAGTQSPGTSGPTKAGGNGKFAEGGKTPMFGNRGSLPARGGRMQ